MENAPIQRTPDEVREHIAKLIQKAQIDDTTGFKVRDLQNIYQKIEDDTSSDELNKIMRQANATATGI